ncbi:hypothetical protein GGG16DRAFT_44445 [Schizophyllum commune]
MEDHVGERLGLSANPPWTGSNVVAAAAMSMGDASTTSKANQPSGSDHGLPSPPTLSRPFRSRKNRPCDACRRAKTRCAIPAAGPPCVECQQTRKQCTFDQLPPERKKPAKRPGSPVSGSVSPGGPSSTDKRPRVVSSASMSGQENSNGLDALIHAASREKRLAISPYPEPISLDLSTPDALEPHVITALLTDDLLPIGAKQAGPDHTQLPETSYIRQISTVGSKPQYIIFTQKPKKTQDTNQLAREALLRLDSSLQLLRPPPNERLLQELFFAHFNSAFPLLVPHHINPNDHPCLLVKLYLTALNHTRQYRHAAKAVRRLVHNGASSFIENGTPLAPRLHSIAGAVLELSGRPVWDAEARYIALSRTIAQAQLMGLHIDPGNWAIPAWEKEHRRVLWWTLRIHDGWMSFLNSRPSHLQLDNTNVPLPALPSMLATSAPSSPSSAPSPSGPSIKAEHPDQVSPASIRSLQSFLYQCRIGALVNRLQAQVSTLTAATLITREERLRRVQDLEADAAALLDEVKLEWEELGIGVPGRSPMKPSGVACLMTTLLCFRCMLRRVSIELYIGLGSPFVPDDDTLTIFADAVDYFCLLDGYDFDSFWLCHIGHILSSVTSSLLRLSLAMAFNHQQQVQQHLQQQQQRAQAEGQPRPPIPPPSSFMTQASARTCPIVLLSRLRNAVHFARQEHDWDLADASLQRTASVAHCLQHADEYAGIVSALQGRIALGANCGLHIHQAASGSGGAESMLLGSSAGAGSVQIPGAGPMQGIDQSAWNLDLSALGLDWGYDGGFDSWAGGAPRMGMGGMGGGAGGMGSGMGQGMPQVMPTGGPSPTYSHSSDLRRVAPDGMHLEDGISN